MEMLEDNGERIVGEELGRGVENGTDGIVHVATWWSLFN